MQTAQTVPELRTLLRPRRATGIVGFVPTMGALHDGHLALIRRAKAECDAVVVSVFVNPTQFNDKTDFEKYPRDAVRDAALIETAGGDVLFLPDVAKMYSENDTTGVTVGGALTETLEGAHRPGHFAGVTTVVTKLFNIVQPDKAYFGEKDRQQLLVITRMVSDLKMAVEIVPCETVREPDGLALSSRNVRLSPEARAQAKVIPYLLQTAQDLLDSNTYETQTDRAGVIQSWLLTLLQSHLPGAAPDYIAVVHPETLEPLDIIETNALVAIALPVGGVRLIDNRIITRR